MQFIPEVIVKKLDINKDLVKLASMILEELQGIYSEVDRTVLVNQFKVIEAMQRAKLSYNHFIFSTGYGYGDIGRDVVDTIFSYVFNTEDALVRPHFVSGTHALSTALFGVLRPGDELIYATGVPYDTMKTVINGRTGEGSLKEYDIKYKEIALNDDGFIDTKSLIKSISSKTRVVMFQRSKGYSWRPSLDVNSLGMAIKAVKEIKNDVICMVDNCYGEFVEDIEPSDVGADIVAGSLIKNPGGGIAVSGGYIAGKKELIEKFHIDIQLLALGSIWGLILVTHVIYYKVCLWLLMSLARPLKELFFHPVCLKNSVLR
jgi:Aluminium resistance protein.